MYFIILDTNNLKIGSDTKKVKMYAKILTCTECNWTAIDLSYYYNMRVANVTFRHYGQLLSVQTGGGRTLFWNCLLQSLFYPLL